MNQTSLYEEVELTTEVMAASNHRLIQMLYEKSLQQLQITKTNIQNAQLEARNKNISRTYDIITYLRSCLNFKDENTKELSSMLDNNYIMIEKCLLNATLKNDIESINTALIILTNIKSGWDEIG